MQLKAFEAGRYDDDWIVIRNPENGKQEIFSEDEFEIVKFLKKNENETLLALLLPNIGIAKKNHIVICLKVLSKLKRMQLVDHFALTGRKPVSNTGTIELEVTKERIQFAGLRSLAAVFFAIFERGFSWMGAAPLLLLSLIIASTSVVFFPFDRLEAAIRADGISYGSFFLVIYLSASGAFCLRALLQATFLRAMGREAKKHGFAFNIPFLSLHSDKSDVNLLGFRSRMQLSFLGLIAPIAFSGIFTLLAAFGKISLVTAYAGFAACLGVALLLAAPIFAFDISQILHMILLRSELQERISKGLKEIFHTKGSLSREMLVALLCTFVWILIWLDCLRAFWEIFSAQIVADFFTPASLSGKVGAAALMALALLLVLLPIIVFAVGSIGSKFGKRRQKLEIRKDKLKDSLTFEERMAALEKIPLFAYLNDQERLSLLNEMQPVFYRDGDFLVHQGEIGKEFYVLVKGHANVSFRDVKGKNYHLADLQEGDAFGEIALIDDVPRTASILSDGGCIALVLKKEGFDRFAASLGSSDRVKTLIRLTSFFRRHPLFSKLTAKEQAMLIDSFLFRTITSGEEIADAESDENFYVVYSGKVRVDTGDDSAETSLEPDDCFGYANVLHAKYVAIEGTGLLCVRQEEFHSLIWAKLVERPELFF
jgi:CRP-like cAMP-binding protein